MQSLRYNLRIDLIYWKVMFHFQDTQFFVLLFPQLQKL